MSPHISLTLSLILFCASIVVNIKTVILVLWIRKFIKNQIKLNKLEKHMDFQEEVLKKMDIKSNYILSLTHVEDNLYKLKTEDDKEYLCRKLNGGDSSCTHYVIDNIDKETMERIQKVKHVSVGYKLDYVDDNHVRYTTSLSSGSTDKELPPLKIPDCFKFDMDKINEKKT